MVSHRKFLTYQATRTHFNIDTVIYKKETKLSRRKNLKVSPEARIKIPR